MKKGIFALLTFLNIISVIHGVTTQAQLTLNGSVPVSTRMVLTEMATDLGEIGSAVRSVVLGTAAVYTNSTTGYRLTVDSLNDGYLNKVGGQGLDTQRLPYNFSFYAAPVGQEQAFSVNGILRNSGFFLSHEATHVLEATGQNLAPINGQIVYLLLSVPIQTLIEQGTYTDQLTVSIENL